MAFNRTIINDNKPDIFIWINIPYCLNVHEKIFRQGNICKQRKIIEWFERVKDTNYELIGQASNVLVFKLKNNGIPTNYKFFEKKELESNPEKVKIEY